MISLLDSKHPKVPNVFRMKPTPCQLSQTFQDLALLAHTCFHTTCAPLRLHCLLFFSMFLLAFSMLRYPKFLHPQQLFLVRCRLPSRLSLNTVFLYEIFPWPSLIIPCLSLFNAILWYSLCVYVLFPSLGCKILEDGIVKFCLTHLSVSL